MNIAIVGSNSFIAKNFYIHLMNDIDINKIYLINKKTTKKNIKNYVRLSDIIFIFAGINRPRTKNEYKKNFEIVKKIVSYVDKKKKFFFMSSSQSGQPNEYGMSKKKCENFLIKLYKKKIIDLKIYRLPNIFGKWSKPNYNSVVATFCFNIINKKPLNIIENKKITLLYIDDLIKIMLADLKKKKNDRLTICDQFKYTFKIKIIKLKRIIESIHNNYKSKDLLNYNSKIKKYLYSTYLSFLSKNNYKYEIKNAYINNSGSFVELLKSRYAGQISLLNIRGKEKRGGHFHNTKYERFCVIDGKVRYSSKDMFENKRFTTILKDSNLEIVTTIPGQIHFLKNLSIKPSKILVWSNEIFDKKNPDTFFYKS